MLGSVQAAGLTEIYDRFIVTRSDLFYLCPHPPLDCLDPDSLWIPDGEDYGGLNDKHLVVSAANLVASCNLIDDFLSRPQEMRQAMISKSDWNSEQVHAFHMTRKGLNSKIKRFPYVMFLVESLRDPTADSPGNGVAPASMFAKYPSELHEATRYQQLIRSDEDWRDYFAARRLPDQRPARLYTTHGTVFYVDKVTKELRHGSVSDAVDNVVFVSNDKVGRLVHRAGAYLYNIMYNVDSSRSLEDSVVADWASRSTELEVVPIYSGFAPDQSLTTNNLVGLKSNNLYICAEPDGRVSLSRTQCLAWEHFRIVADFKQDTLHVTARTASASAEKNTRKDDLPINVAIVTAADADFFDLLQGLVRSLRDKPQGAAS
jgi:hypothetical protein